MRNLTSQRESCFSPLDVEKIDQLLTLEVVCPRAQWIMRRQFRKRVHHSMNLESVFGESLHYGIKRHVPFTNRTGSTMNVNFEVTDTKRAILSVHEGCGNRSMIVFTPDGKSKIVNDTKCIDQVKQIMASTPGFDSVYDRGAFVLDVDVDDGVYVNEERRKFESDSGISFPVIRKESWERALNQAQQDHERKESIQQDVHGANQNTFEYVKVKVLPKPYEPTKEDSQSHEATHCPFRAWCEICVKAKNPDGKHAKQVVNSEDILVIEYDYAFATDMPGDPNRNISMMVATDSIHGSIFAVVARRNGGQDDYVMQSFQKLHRSIGFGEGRIEMWPSTLDVANALIKRCQSTALIVIATPIGSNGSLGRGERANLQIQEQLRAFRGAVSMKYKTEVGPDHMLMGWMVRHCAWVVNNFQVKGTRRTPFRSIRAGTTLEKSCHLEKFVWAEIIQRMEPN